LALSVGFVLGLFQIAMQERLGGAIKGGLRAFTVAGKNAGQKQNG
jgi:hypothetical protein